MIDIELIQERPPSSEKNGELLDERLAERTLGRPPRGMAVEMTAVLVPDDLMPLLLSDDPTAGRFIPTLKVKLCSRRSDNLKLLAIQKDHTALGTVMLILDSGGLFVTGVAKVEYIFNAKAREFLFREADLIRAWVLPHLMKHCSSNNSSEMRAALKKAVTLIDEEPNLSLVTGGFNSGYVN